MSTVEGMADLPFGFSAGDDPERDEDEDRDTEQRQPDLDETAADPARRLRPHERVCPASRRSGPRSGHWRDVCRRYWSDPLAIGTKPLTPGVVAV